MEFESIFIRFMKSIRFGPGSIEYINNRFSLYIFYLFSPPLSRSFVSALSLSPYLCSLLVISSLSSLSSIHLFLISLFFLLFSSFPRPPNLPLSPLFFFLLILQFASFLLSLVPIKIYYTNISFVSMFINLPIFEIPFVSIITIVRIYMRKRGDLKKK